MLYTVPLFAGFMYSAVGSYIARCWRIFKFYFTDYPPFIYTALLEPLLENDTYFVVELQVKALKTRTNITILLDSDEVLLARESPLLAPPIIRLDARLQP